MEHGCIPIVEDDTHAAVVCDSHRACAHNQPHYFHNLLGGPPPFPTVARWADATPVVRALLADRIALQRLQTRCLEWYSTHKRALARTVATRLLGPR